MAIDILKLIPLKKTLQHEYYVAHDEIYALWKLGYNLAEVFSTASDIKNKQDAGQGIARFQYVYNKVRSHSRVINEKNPFIDRSLSDALKKEKIIIKDFQSIKSFIKDITESLEYEIRSYSTHLANVFLFGFYFSKLRLILLQQADNKTEIDETINDLLNNIGYIVKGNKKLESPNLEISLINLKILKSSILLLKRKIRRIINNREGKHAAYQKLINESFFKPLTDIILDIKNPIQYIKNRFFLFLIYYYMFAIVLAFIELLFSNEFGSKFIEFISVFGAGDGTKLIEWVIYILPLIIYVFVIFFKNCNQLIMKLFIRARINKQIVKFYKGEN